MRIDPVTSDFCEYSSGFGKVRLSKVAEVRPAQQAYGFKLSVEPEVGRRDRMLGGSRMNQTRRP